MIHEGNPNESHSAIELHIPQNDQVSVSVEQTEQAYKISESAKGIIT